MTPKTNNSSTASSLLAAALLVNAMAPLPAQTGEPGEGWLTPPSEGLRVVSGEVEQLHLSDIDGDGDADILFDLDGQPFGNAGARVGLLRNQGNASFAPEVTVMLGSGQLLVADVDGQLGPDLILLGPGATGLVSLNDGSGSFAPATAAFPAIPSGLPFFSATTVDVDGDSDIDVAAVDSQSMLRLYLNSGGLQGGTPGQFNAGQALSIGSFEFGLPGGELIGGDLNADGAPDLVLLFEPPLEGRHEIISLINQSGQFAITQRVDDPSAKDIDLGDANGDPFADLLIGRSGSARSTFQLGLGNGSFLPAAFGFPQRLRDGPVAIVELFGGVPDEVVITGFLANPPNLLQGESTVSVWTEGPLFERFRHIGQCPLQRIQPVDAIAFGDLDADGDLDLVYTEQSFVALPNGNPASVIGFQLNGPNNGGQACCASEQSARVMLPVAPTPGSGNQPSTGTGSAQDFLDLNLLYRLRDEVMRPRIEGNRLVNLYQALAPEFFVAQMDYNRLLQTNSLLRAWQPNFAALVDGNGGSALISSGQIQEAELVLNLLTASGQAALSQTIASERARLGPLSQFIGWNMDQFADALLGPTDVLLNDGFESP